MLGFTEREQRFFWFLIVCFLVGSGIRFYQNRFAALPEPEGFSPALATPDSTVAGEPDRRDEQSQKRPQLVGVLSINHAGADELAGLPGIGPVLAHRIVNFRTENGPFRNPEDLLKVQGIGSKKLEHIRTHIQIHSSSEVSR
ncbi:MAG TPA: helix-hairpin-helix domain-containing protein [bacterium]|nr:helix-hairpin-helix domain-containing protein [bacterium]